MQFQEIPEIDGNLRLVVDRCVPGWENVAGDVHRAVAVVDITNQENEVLAPARQS
jgi:hypothetical protein